MTNQALPQQVPDDERDQEAQYIPVDDNGVPIPAEEAMPETGGVALFSMFSKGGHEIKFTVRSWTARGVIDRTADAIQYAHTKYGWTGSPQSAPKPAPATQPMPAPVQSQAISKPAPAPKAPDSGEEINQETIRVKSVFHDVASNGTHHLKIEGGIYTKFGVPMWPESAPDGVMDMIMAWPLKQKFTPPAGMGQAVIEKRGNKARVIKLMD